MLDGTIVESDPPRRLVMTFHPLWTGEGENAPVSRVTWEITPHEDLSKLALIHEGLDLDSDLGAGVQDGWTRDHVRDEDLSRDAASSGRGRGLTRFPFAIGSSPAPGPLQPSRRCFSRLTRNRGAGPRGCYKDGNGPISGE